MDDSEWHEGQVAIPSDLTSPVTLDKIYVSALNTTDSEEEITIYGVNEDSKYINTKNIPDTRNQVLVSKGYMEKYGLKENQTIELWQ